MPLAIPQEIAHLWTTVDPASVTQPTWRTHESFTEFRICGGDARLVVEGDVLRLMIRSYRPFLLVFGSLFIPSFMAIAWFFIPDPPIRAVFVVGGPFCGIFVFAIIYGIQHYHEGLGDYLVIDRGSGKVELPRCKKQFQRTDVNGFQWIRGRERFIGGDVEIATDLNLLVSEPAGTIRYHVMRQPSRRIIQRVVAFSRIDIDEIQLGWWRGDRIADCMTAKKMV